MGTNNKREEIIPKNQASIHPEERLFDDHKLYQSRIMELWPIQGKDTTFATASSLITYSAWQATLTEQEIAFFSNKKPVPFEEQKRMREERDAAKVALKKLINAYPDSAEAALIMVSQDPHTPHHEAQKELIRRVLKEKTLHHAALEHGQYLKDNGIVPAGNSSLATSATAVAPSNSSIIKS